MNELSEYVILDENNIITNIIICSSDADAKMFNALPIYDGAKIGDKYEPPLIYSNYSITLILNELLS